MHNRSSIDGDNKGKNAVLKEEARVADLLSMVENQGNDGEKAHGREVREDEKDEVMSRDVEGKGGKIKV